MGKKWSGLGWGAVWGEGRGWRQRAGLDGMTSGQEHLAAAGSVESSGFRGPRLHWFLSMEPF